MKQDKKPTTLQKTKERIKEIIHFLSHDLWRINTDDVGEKRNVLFNFLKAIIMTFRNSMELQINSRAASLTFRTILSVIPVLAVLFAIGRGFGLQNMIEQELYHYFEGQRELLNQAIEFIDNSLKHAKGGIFAGVGVLVLLYTVYSLFSNIEDNFNRIWQIKQGRTYYRRMIDYFALVLIIPVFIITNSGISIFIGSSAGYFKTFGFIISPITATILKILPYAITIMVFTLLYLLMPNTNVKFFNALLAGILAGSAYQVFQMVYISGQLWITKYNAIYGSFAAIPLLLLWLQLSWYIILLGVEFSYSLQNVKKFTFEKETRNISRRYSDFFLILIASVIVKRFANGDPPYTADQISDGNKIPVRLTNKLISDLEMMEIISRTPIDINDNRIMAYQPAVDINIITVSYLMKKVDEFGSEDFAIDTKIKYSSHWKVLLESRNSPFNSEENILLKDL